MALTEAQPYIVSGDNPKCFETHLPNASRSRLRGLRPRCRAARGACEQVPSRADTGSRDLLRMLQGSGFRGLGFRGLGVQGFRGSGFRDLGVRGLVHILFPCLAS